MITKHLLIKCSYSSKMSTIKKINYIIIELLALSIHIEFGYYMSSNILASVPPSASFC
jgi:hypothetical protein